jgi:hypothetical protein
VIARACLALCLVALVLGAPARAEYDWSLDIPMPDADLAFAVGGGLALGEAGRPGDLGGLATLTASWLDGPFGVHLSAVGHQERRAQRIGGALEATVWYVLLLGAGVSHGVMNADGGPEVPREVTALTFFVGAPWPVARYDSGTLVLLAWARPSTRFEAGDELTLSTQLGVNLAWTTFGF